MKPETIKQAVISFLNGKDWQYGGTICREVAYIIKHKESVIERHALRSELIKGDNSIIERMKVDNPSGKGAQVYKYRLRPPRVLPQYRVENVKQLNLI